MAKGFDLGGLLGQAQALQEKLRAAQEELAGRTVEGSAGGGMVRVVVNGRIEVVSVQIEPQVVAEPDLAMLQDLVTAATNDGIRKAQAMVAEEMGKLTGGLGLKLPGFGS
jgi:DNA-binding YbaB/EbfC family protein